MGAKEDSNIWVQKSFIIIVWVLVKRYIEAYFDGNDHSRTRKKTKKIFK